MAGPVLGKWNSSGENWRLGKPGEVSTRAGAGSISQALVRPGEDIRLFVVPEFLPFFASGMFPTIRVRDAVVLVGGGVCIESADRFDEVASSSCFVLTGVSSVSAVRWQARFEVDEGLGDEDKRREGSTGGSVRSGLGDRWWTWEAICSSMFWPGSGLFVPADLVGLLSGVEKARNLGVFRKSGLSAHGSAVFHVTRGS